MEIYLTRQNFNCDVAFNGKSASDKINATNYDFILLDLGLPDMDGLDLLKESKKNGIEGAFIVLTARGEVEDKIAGLDLGADDYIAKPFSLAELHSRMQAILRRKHGLKSNTMSIGDFEIDIQNRTVHCNGELVNITKKEFDLLHYLGLHKNRVLTRIQLTEHIWGDVLEDDYESNYIDVHVKNLRKKLVAHGNIDWLETVRGVGYRVNI
jgi:DNA-binding response OmpR family regulator